MLRFVVHIPPSVCCCSTLQIRVQRSHLSHSWCSSRAHHRRMHPQNNLQKPGYSKTSETKTQWNPIGLQVFRQWFLALIRRDGNDLQISPLSQLFFRLHGPHSGPFQYMQTIPFCVLVQNCQLGWCMEYMKCVDYGTNPKSSGGRNDCFHKRVFLSLAEAIPNRCMKIAKQNSASLVSDSFHLHGEPETTVRFFAGIPYLALITRQ